MTKQQLTKNLATALAETLLSKALTPETLADFLLSSGLVSEMRARQYCAVREFYRLYASQKKCELIEEMSQKYAVSARLMKSLTTEQRRFSF
jgi:hypothetical protein